VSSYSTGVVGPSHRAVMHEGVVIAVAETVTLASVIVRALNDQEKESPEPVPYASATDEWVDLDGNMYWTEVGAKPPPGRGVRRRMPGEKEENVKTMQLVKIGNGQVYVDLNCGETTSWDETDSAVVAEYGSIENLGCDRCESGEARWVKVWAEQ
jgi:hypothetical protein